MVSPVLAAGLILLIVGGYAAWHVHQSNARASRELDRAISEMVASEQLLLSIRDLRAELDLYWATRRPEFFEVANQVYQDISLRLARVREIVQPRGNPFLDRITQGHAAFARHLQASPDELWEKIDAIREELTTQVMEPARLLLEERQITARSNSSANQHTSDRVGLGLFILGLCGAISGLLGGYAIARMVSRSIEQLGGTVAGMATALGGTGDDSPPVITKDLPALHSTMQFLADRTVHVVEELRQTRQHVERSDQLAALGQLAAGLAHEIRNPLTSVKLLVQNAEERRIGLDERELEILTEEIARLEKLLQTFLDFARPPKLEKLPVDVHELLEQSLRLIGQAALKQGVELVYQRDPAELSLDADPQHLRQVILNLLLNSLDAQPEGGRIVLRASRVRVGGDWNSADPLGFEVVIRIEDEGPGVPAHLGEKIFEPFVSTKETGVGLGLSICRRIVESHGGEIMVSAGGNGGAVFELHFPESCAIDGTGIAELEVGRR